MTSMTSSELIVLPLPRQSVQAGRKASTSLGALPAGVLLWTGWKIGSAVFLGAGFAAGVIYLGVVGYSLLTPASITLGIEGLSLALSGRRGYFPYSGIADVGTWKAAGEAKQGAAKKVSFFVETSSGEQWVIDVGDEADDASTRESRKTRRQLVDVIRERIDLSDERDTRFEASLSQGSDQLAAWVKSLRESGQPGREDHRSQPLEVDRLWAVIETPGAVPVTRVAAAVALASGLDQPGKVRLLHAARSIALPGLRKSLTEIAEATDETAEAVAIRALRTHQRSAG